MSNIIPVRIPELPARVTYVPALELHDKLPVWIASVNKTVWTDLADIRLLIVTGSGQPYTPVSNGGAILYIVPEPAHGTKLADIPIAANQDFTLKREGYPLIKQQYDQQGNPTVPVDQLEYEVLSSGGFRLLKANDFLIEGQRYELQFYSVTPGGGPGGPTTPTPTGTPFIKGNAIISANTILTAADHANKINQLRAQATKVTATLPLVDDVPKDSVFIFEADINNAVENTINTQGGQFIYMNSSGRDKLYIRPGEVLWLYRGDDGYYVINDFGSIYKELAKPYASYRVDSNEILLKGQLLNRADYPRLWEYVLTLGASLVTDTIWQTASAKIYAGTPDERTILKPYRGCFSTGDGQTTFRVPDMMNMFLRSVKTEVGADAERVANRPGGYQDDIFKKHGHKVYTTGGQGATDPGRGLQRSASNGDTYDNGQGNNPYIEEVGGLETRPENIGVLWVIKC